MPSKGKSSVMRAGKQTVNFAGRLRNHAPSCLQYGAEVGTLGSAESLTNQENWFPGSGAKRRTVIPKSYTVCLLPLLALPGLLAFHAAPDWLALDAAEDGEAAIDGNDDAGYEVGGRTDQPEQGADQVRRYAQASRGGVRENGLSARS